MAVIFTGVFSFQCHCLVVIFQLTLTVSNFSFSSAINDLLRIFHGFVYYSFM